jgi:hypothetical protein
VVSVGGRGIFYLVGVPTPIDLDDFFEAARVNWNLSVLGTGGPMAQSDPAIVDWTVEILPSLREHLVAIVGAAFDEMGLVFWERSS